MAKKARNAAEKSAHEAIKFLKSPAGREALQKVVKRGTPISDGLKKARHIDPRRLLEPIFTRGKIRRC